MSSDFFEWFLRQLKKVIPAPIFNAFAPLYHYTLALAGATLYGFPSRSLFVVGITGTKGKTTTAEVLAAIFEEEGYKVALASTLRFKRAGTSTRNLYKMTMPGRFTLQRFLREAVVANCSHAVIEMTSEGVKLYRHKFIELDALIFTNLSPEHIEAHGSYENYLNAKLEIAHALEESKKTTKFIAANRDDKEAARFLAKNVEHKIPYGIADAEPITEDASGATFIWEGETIRTHLKGRFNVYNIIAAATLAKALGISTKTIKEAVEKIDHIPGRMERITPEATDGATQATPFDVYVDYAHTPDSLEKVYETLKNKLKICVLGGTGGGRDKWKRPQMGALAAAHCKEIILTDEDPYDESPYEILYDIQKGIDEKIKELKAAGKDTPPVEVIIDRSEAIKESIRRARPKDAVVITGKGTDPFIMGPDGSKIPWDDAAVAREALASYLERS